PAGPYNYLWSDFSTGMTLQTNVTGSYIIDVTDTITGCTTADTITVNVPTSPSFTLADTSFCGSQYTINGPVGQYMYMWSTGDSTSSITVPGPGGSYTLTVVDVTSGCDGTDSSIVNINAIPTVTATASTTSPCTDDANVILTGSPAGGTFTGTSVTGNQFDPSIGGGSYVVIYNFTDVNGCPGADTVVIDVSPCVGINEPFVAAGMNVYPNPNAGMFVFTAADQDCNELTIEIVTVEGQVVQTNKHSNVQGNFTEEIDMTEFANGVYIMRVTTDGAVFTQRIVKQD
ncbi:MAG TPA: T9SS type A sorting domain-containing protein, partial [Bacteroidia bacterium]|nr:T9SS type A sorting domain-containing protein [Bacteroidia bacterium]